MPPAAVLRARLAARGGPGPERARRRPWRRTGAAFQGRGAPQDWACQASKASAASQAMLDCPDHQASRGLPASPALQDRPIVTRV